MSERKNKNENESKNERKTKSKNERKAESENESKSKNERKNENASDALTEFGLEIRRHREALHLNLDGLADRSGLTPNYIGNIENGYRDPSISSIGALASGLGIPVSDLLGTVLGMSIAAQHAARKFEGVSPEMKKAVLALMACVSKKPQENLGDDGDVGPEDDLTAG